ncbi:Protein FAR1-RELATED SEQUENCE 7, partial [Ananas comosus]
MPENTGSNTKEKKPRLAPAVVFPPPVQPLRPVQIPGNPSVDPRLGHVWPRHLVLLSPYPPWTTQPPVPRESIPSDSHHHHQREKMSNAPRTDANTPLEVIDEKLLPKVDMLFDSENEAYEFYNTYAENVGFFVRRSTLWTTSKNIITRRTFVCSREGFREKKKGAKEAKCPRPETRIGCPACMTIRLTSNGKYRVTEFVSNHNHMLATVSTIHMLRTKKLRRKARAVRADLVDDSVTTPVFETEDEAYEFYSRIGFSVRRASMTVNSDNAITRRMFVCSREGFREKKKGAKRVKKPRPETRTGCPACMIIRLGQDGKYHVSEFVTYHNHQLAASSSAELVMSNRVENDQDNESDLGDKSETELSSFFEQYERILDERRCAELQADVNASQSTKKPPSMRMLKQAANVYTPNAFKMFEREFELYMDCIIAASRAARSFDSYAFMESQSDVLWDQVEQVLQSRHPDMSTLISSISDRPHNPVENVIAGSIHYDKTNHTSFIGSAADGHQIHKM